MPTTTHPVPTAKFKITIDFAMFSMSFNSTRIDSNVEKKPHAKQYRYNIEALACEEAIQCSHTQTISPTPSVTGKVNLKFTFTLSGATHL